MSPEESELQDRVQSILGTVTMIAASLFAVLIFADRMEMDFVRLPSAWYSSRSFHLVLCGAMFFVAAILLKSPPAKPGREGRPLFKSCRLLTRQGCHLCDEALAVLLQYQEVLPAIEIVDIDDDSQLVRMFGESIPVIEIDGRVRFRGAVQPRLLQRMIDAAELRLENPVTQMTHSKETFCSRE